MSGLAGRVVQPGGQTLPDSAAEATRASLKSASQDVLGGQPYLLLLLGLLSP